MNPEKSHRSQNKPKRHFAGCIELIPAAPNYIEFIDTHRIWVFPIHHLTHFVLQENCQHADRKTLPPDQIVLIYSPAIVILKGWRLELLLGPLVNGRVARIHAEKHLGSLIIEEAWVAEIQVLLNDNTVLDQEKLQQRIANQP